ncbi:MAG: hypothetical protein BWX98_01223 [Candidatus Aminicenantes bacterium ADurb.Bin147]|nr:MAG: hypothetical protein BWX98_01223 [Candidatus Aminicenantes bacterium ADurb.Bin147]
MRTAYSGIRTARAARRLVPGRVVTMKMHWPSTRRHSRQVLISPKASAPRMKNSRAAGICFRIFARVWIE